MSDTAPSIVANEPEPDLSGRRLGDFQLLRRLGRGAMAEVYQAQQESLNRQVALKVLKRSLAGDATYVQRFHHEAQAAAALVHANIVQIYEVGCCEGVHYIAQEYVAGLNLREWFTRHGTLDLKRAVTVMRQVTLALQKAADRGIVHRDIKPENIMLTPALEVKVADFGLARLAETSGQLQLTQVGMTMGTPLYMSPEQVEGRALDTRSDIYSFGVTCFHMLAGVPPFRGETALSVAVQHLKSAPQRLEELRPDLPPALCRIVHRMLAKEADERYTTPRELLAELREVPVTGADDDAWDATFASAGMDETELASRSHAQQQLAEVMQTAAVMRVERSRRRRGWLVAVVGMFLVGALAGWANRERPLLTKARASDVPKYSSAREQFFVALLQADRQDAWLRSVEKYFATDDYYVPRSQLELARLYLRHNQTTEALAACERLANYRSAGQEEFRAFGLAGIAAVTSMRGDHARAAQALAELAPLRDKLDSRTGALVAYAVGQNRRALGQKASQEWDSWLKSLPADDSEPPGS
jgi:serine/threonine-protein kinase